MLTQSKVAGVGLALCLALSLCCQASAFIRVQGTKFVDEQCNEFTFVGANTYAPRGGRALGAQRW